MIKNFSLIFIATTFIVIWFGVADMMIAAYVVETKFIDDVNVLWRACNGNANCGIAGMFMNIAALSVFMAWFCSI